MPGFYDQNPVTLRIDKMRMKWNKQVTRNDINLVRWLVQQDEVRMVEGFSKLEATEFAQLPDMFLTLESEFLDYESYPQSLAKEFLDRFEDERALKEAAAANIILNWDHRPFKNIAQPDVFAMLADHLASFPKFAGNMVIYLKPRRCYSIELFRKWIGEQLENFPPRLRIMLHDHLGSEQFNSLVAGDNSVSIIAALDMAGAMKEIINTAKGSGNPRAKFTSCIYQMGQECAANNRDGVDKWGTQAMGIAKSLKDPSLEATTLLAWGINMQVLKDGAQTLNYYEQAVDVCKASVVDNETTFAPLLIQSIAFKAAALMQQKKLKEAAVQYEIMAGYSNAYRQPNMEMEAWWQAGEVHKRLSDNVEMLAAYKKGYDSGLTIAPEILKATRFPVIALKLYETTEHLDYVYADEIDAKMIALFDRDWKQTITEQYIGNPASNPDVQPAYKV